ncbi:Hypothetical protein FKW44_006083, partial [Caligus rogercresseyi]
SDNEDTALDIESEEDKAVEKYKSDQGDSSDNEPDIPGNRRDGIDNADIDDSLQPEAQEFAPTEIQNELEDEKED